MMQVNNTYFNGSLSFTKQLSIKVSLPKRWHINEALTLDRKKSVVTKGVVEGGCNGCNLLLPNYSQFTVIVWYHKGTSRLKMGEGLKLYIRTQGYLFPL